MQMDEAKQGSRFKTVVKVFWWVLGTAAAVPITKWVESQLSLSFFSPSIVELWNWMLSMGTLLAQPVSVPLWLLLTIVVCTLFMTVALGRMSMDADREQKAKDAILDATYAKLDDTISELDSVDEELNATKSELGFTNVKLDTAESDLAAAYAKISDLETPSLPPLTNHQDKVMAAIAAYDSVGQRCYAKQFPPQIGLTLLEADGAMDGLIRMELIKVRYLGSGRAVTLTAAGREYVLKPMAPPAVVPPAT